jgi:uncharacterized integral membrane protein
MFTLIIVILIIAFVTLFSVQNATPVAISLITWKFEASLAVVVFLSVLAGIFIGSIITSVMVAKRSRRKRLRALLSQPPPPEKPDIPTVSN